MIVITGSGGLVGRGLVHRLTQSGRKFITLSARKPEAYGWLGYLSQRGIEPTVLVHLAAAVPKPPIIPDTENLARKTLGLDREAYEVCERFSCHVIYASGCSLYSPQALKQGAREDSQLRSLSELQSPYLAAKLQGEQLIRSTGRATIFRLSTPVGDRLSKSSALGALIDNAKSNRPIRYFGSGLREQNYVDVLDIARAIEAAISKRPVETINLASEEQVTMKELVRLVSTMYPDVTVGVPLAHDPKDGELCRIDISKAKAMLGWDSLIPFHDSLKRAGLDGDDL